MNYPDADDLENGKFTDGDPIKGIPPSMDSAAHMNAIYDEMIAVIEGAAITPDSKKTSQLLEAINYYRNASNIVEGVVPEAHLPDTLLYKSDFDLTGSVHWFATQAAPAGFIKANGAAISRIDYADLFAKIGTLYGEGDGSTTFNVPDLRGEFVRGWDDGRGVDVGRNLGKPQKGSLLAFDDGNQVLTLVQSGYSNWQNSMGFDQPNLSEYQDRRFYTDHRPTDGGLNYSPYMNDIRYWATSRPRNIALAAYIKY
ncbi:hypothetical protein CBF23_006525 [Marinomonas agarivorans]|nr:hypothetical protein CBF23_006525 [Marinomonas agarivorans]